MSEISELLSLEKCGCGRFWCDYFAPGAGEHGLSFSKERLKDKLEELQQMKIDIKKLEKLIKKLLR